MTITGFDVPEIDLILQDDAEEEEEDVSGVPGAAVSQLGDLWSLGEHRIFCGSSLEETSYTNVMDGESSGAAYLDDTETKSSPLDTATMNRSMYAAQAGR